MAVRCGDRVVSSPAVVNGIVYDLVGLVHAAHAMVIPPLEITWYPGDAWVAAGILYVLAPTGPVFVIATVRGIATLDLSLYAKTGQMPGSSEKTRELS
ncbi:MAG: hypothetical protein ABFC24_13100 [Methanoregulaceae archaeon]